MLATKYLNCKLKEPDNVVGEGEDNDDDDDEPSFGRLEWKIELILDNQTSDDTVA